MFMISTGLKIDVYRGRIINKTEMCEADSRTHWHDVYQSKDGKEEKIFDALEWLAAMCSHVPNKGEQMVRYYGFYSNVSRGKRKRKHQDDLISSILEPEGSSSEYRKNWARLIQKIYEVDPLRCPKCQAE